ncbi:MAG: ATP-binding protein [Desulfobulbaceae bacterium]|nr:ATP-binding protein [Desulfobulbaceae bacterium]
MEDLSKTQLMTGDEAYLETYQQIYQLFCQKAQVLYGNPYAFENPKVQTQELCIELAGINEEIRRVERDFWISVERCKEAAQMFSVEKIADLHNLDVFEKRVMLLMIFLKINQPSDQGYSPEQILQILDVNNSVTERFKNLFYFSNKASAFVKEILLVSQRNYPRVQEMEYQINPKIMRQISSLVRGEGQSWSKADQDSEWLHVPENEGRANVRDIGSVRAPEYTLDDVHLNPAIKEKILLFLDGCKDNAFEKFGISNAIKKGTGTAFLFYGLPGSGKSMMAEAIASYMKKKVLAVDYPKVTSQWFGETDKRIAAIFSQARKKDLVIVLDEADTLLYNRGYAGQEHNIRFVNEMLQELERFEGVVILTTNMHTLLDPALERRIALKIKFELPDQKIREDIWRSHIPKEMEIDADVDFNRLATAYEFSGGNIKNAVLNAFRKLIQSKATRLTMGMLIAGADIEKEGLYNSKANKRFIGFATASGAGS